MSNTDRPLSPHLQVYRLPMAAILSITHRITGAALGLGAVLMVWWLFAALCGEGAFTLLRDFRASVIGRLMLFGWLLAFVYHFLNGIRHLKWDFARGLSKESVARTNYVVIAGALVLTALIWMQGGR